MPFWGNKNRLSLIGGLLLLLLFLFYEEKILEQLLVFKLSLIFWRAGVNLFTPSDTDCDNLLKTLNKCIPSLYILLNINHQPLSTSII